MPLKLSLVEASVVIGNSSFKGENLKKKRLKLTKFSMNMTAQSVLFILKRFGIVLPFVCWLTNVYISHWSVKKNNWIYALYNPPYVVCL